MLVGGLLAELFLLIGWLIGGLLISWMVGW